MSAPLVVAEVFGPTIQGEGPSTGMRCAFVRLGGCNLHCTWCDTPYTWDWRHYDPKTELHTEVPGEIAQRVRQLDVPMVVITGGEPLLQQTRGLPELLDALPEGMRVEVETNGTRAPRAEIAARVTQFNVSPKLAHAGDPAQRRIKPASLLALQNTGKAVWKFVVQQHSDLDEVEVLVRAYKLAPVYVMPEGTDATSLNQRGANLADEVMRRGWNMTGRLHVQLWGDRRGV